MTAFSRPTLRSRRIRRERVLEKPQVFGYNFPKEPEIPGPAADPGPAPRAGGTSEEKHGKSEIHLCLYGLRI